MAELKLQKQSSYQGVKAAIQMSQLPSNVSCFAPNLLLVMSNDSPWKKTCVYGTELCNMSKSIQLFLKVSEINATSVNFSPFFPFFSSSHHLKTCLCQGIRHCSRRTQLQVVPQELLNIILARPQCVHVNDTFLNYDLFCRTTVVASS